MFHSHAKYLTVIAFLLCGVAASAQTSSNFSDPNNGHDNDPYSKFGIGRMVNGNNTVLRGMGNITSAYKDPYSVNSDNPASYSFLQRTTFEAGATGSSNTLVSGSETYKTSTGTVSYVNLGIPTSKNSGMVLGFRPYTHSYYRLVDTVNTSAIGRYSNLYDGEGSMNYAYIGGAYKYKGLSLGFNLGYMFGSIRNSSVILPSDTFTINNAYTSEYSNYLRLGGLYWKGGAMYEFKTDSFHTLRIGGTITLKQNIKERLNAFQLSRYNFGDSLFTDTTAYAGEQTGKLTLPMSYTFGIMYSRLDKWSVGLDYAATQWSGFNSDPDNTLNLGINTNSYKISVGGEYTPDVNNIRNYFSRVTYRLGAYYGTDYLKVNNTTLPYYGMTAGLSLPFKRTYSRMHMAIDIGRLGLTSNGLIQQTYARFTFGFSLNDKWFIPHKYD